MSEVAAVAISVAAVIAEGAEQLRRAGAREPRREALWLWADLTGTTPAAALLQPAQAAEPAVAEEFLARVARRATGEPLAHVTGSAGFRRLVLRSDRRALIPRPETEGLVELVLDRVRTGRAADIGTGTGCIALSLATEGAFDEVVAVDRCPEALALARENLSTVILRERSDRRIGLPTSRSFALAVLRLRMTMQAGCNVLLVRGDLCAPLRSGAFDALVSNPPYLTDEEYASLDRSVHDWEPAGALASGVDGLEATNRLLEDGRRVLRPGGWLALEVDSTRAAECARRANELGWSDVAIHNDLFGRERYLLARRSETS